VRQERFCDGTWAMAAKDKVISEKLIDQFMATTGF
jgi:hypothetical protein